jgi:hypothetical protein
MPWIACGHYDWLSKVRMKACLRTLVPAPGLICCFPLPSGQQQGKPVLQRAGMLPVNADRQLSPFEAEPMETPPSTKRSKSSFLRATL